MSSSFNLLLRVAAAETFCNRLDRHCVYICGSRKEEFVTVYPADVVLFEGILMFYSQEIRDLFQMKLFVDTDPDTRLSRRGVYALAAHPHWV